MLDDPEIYCGLDRFCARNRTLWWALGGAGLCCMGKGHSSPSALKVSDQE